MTSSPHQQTITFDTVFKETHIVSKQDVDNPSKGMFQSQVIDPYWGHTDEGTLQREHICHPDTIGYQILNRYGEYYQHESKQIFADYNDAQIVWGLAYNKHDPRADLFEEPFWYIHQVRAKTTINHQFLKYDYDRNQFQLCAS